MEVSSQMGPFSIVPEWVLDRGLSSTALKLYIVMARFADWNTGMAFPSRETLAKRMKCSVKTVDRAVIEIVAAECVSKISRGRYASALYQVFQVDPRGTDMTSEWTDMSSEGTDLSSRLDKNDHITITNKQEPLERKPLNDITEKFNDFWATYPRRTGKGNARKALEKALEKTSIDDILAGAERYRDDPNREDAFTQYPATWLNAEGWEDDPLPPRVTAGVRKLTNAEQGALLVRKYEAEEAAEKLRPKEIDVDYGSMMKGLDSE